MKTATSFPSGVTLLVDQTRTRWQASLRMPCWVRAYTCTDGRMESLKTMPTVGSGNIKMKEV